MIGMDPISLHTRPNAHHSLSYTINPSCHTLTAYATPHWLAAITCDPSTATTQMQHGAAITSSTHTKHTGLSC